LSLSVFLFLAPTFFLNFILAQVNPQDDFDEYMQQKQHQEAEHAAYRARIAAHEVSNV
jgi:hypothetical protein